MEPEPAWRAGVSRDRTLRGRMPPIEPARYPWDLLPDIVVHAAVLAVKKHSDYTAAKAGDADAALRLVEDTIADEAVDQLRRLRLEAPILVPIHAFEKTGVNAIPDALAEELGRRLGWGLEREIVQTNLVGHTGSSGFYRLSHQACFDGAVVAGARYVMVDDFVGQGGTLANLRGHIVSLGGRVVAATVLTGKLYSLELALSEDTLARLRSKHGPELEEWWRTRFGHGFDCLTESEARYLLRTPDADRVRDRIAAEEQAGDPGEV